MPLPDGGRDVEWPPRWCEPVNAKIGEWAAWYAGEPDGLAAIYGGSAASSRSSFYGSESGGSPFRAASRAVQKFFWGGKTPATEMRSKFHLPVAGDIAAMSADLLFGQPVKITPPVELESGADVVRERLEDLTGDELWATLLEAAETCAALSGVWIRVIWDRELRPDGPWFTVIQPDAAVPILRMGQCVGVIFWRVIEQKGATITRHLELHEPGWIRHGVYIGTEGALGSPAPLADYPETAGLAGALNDPAGGTGIPTGTQALTAAYVPNMRPNRLWRTAPNAVWYGRSDFAGIEPVMDSLDSTWSSWMRDVDQGRGRLVVPETLIKSLGPGQGGWFDAEQSVFVGLPALPGGGLASDMQKVQFEIRAEMHDRTASALFEQCVARAGYAPETFGLSGGTAMTATESDNRERRSILTRSRKIKYWRPALGDLIMAYLEIGRVQFGWQIPTMIRPDLEWPAYQSPSLLQLSQSLQALDAARAVSTPTKVKMVHPEWESDAVDEEVALIDGPPVPNPDDNTGIVPLAPVPAFPPMPMPPAPPVPANVLPARVTYGG